MSLADRPPSTRSSFDIALLIGRIEVGRGGDRIPDDGAAHGRVPRQGSRLGQAEL
jgi:hypothetical protein